MLIQALIDFLLLVVVGLFAWWLWCKMFGRKAKMDAKNVASKKETLSHMRDRKENLSEEKDVTEDLIETQDELDKVEKEVKKLNKKL